MHRRSANPPCRGSRTPLHERRSITLINAVEGRKRKTIHTQKYGCGVIRYTHHDQVGVPRWYLKRVLRVGSCKYCRI